MLPGMKLNINNNAFDLSSISVLPPRSAGGRVGPPPAASAAASRKHCPQALPPQQQSFSPRRGGGASLPHHSRLLSEASHHGDPSLSSSPARDQMSDLHDDSSKRANLFPSSSASCRREESQLQPAKIPNDAIHRWNPSLIDSRCQVANEDVEHRFQQLSGSVHKVEMVLDLVQNDVIQLNRAMKEASLDSGSIQKKVVLLENPLQQILKGQEGLIALLKDSIRNNSDQLSVSNSGTTKLNEISSILTVWPEQVQADIGQLHGGILRIFTKEMEGISGAIRSLNSRPAAMQVLADQGRSCNEGLHRNQVVVENGMPLANQTPVANVRPQMDQTPSSDGRLPMDQTAVANVRPQMDQTPSSNGRPHKDQITARKLASLPLPLIHSRKAANPKLQVEQGKVKSAPRKLVGSSYRLAPKQELVANQKVNPQLPSKKAPASINADSDDDSKGCASSAVSNTGPAADLMKKEVTSKEGLRTPRSRRKKRREMQHTVVADKALPEDAQSEADETEVAEAAAPTKRLRRPNSKYYASQWATY